MRENAPTASLPTYTPAHYAKLCENEYFRYMPNSDVIGHALFDEAGRAIQFTLPDRTQNLVAPVIGELQALTKFDLPNNKTTLLGFVGETPMISRRAYSISVAQDQENPVSYTFYPLSPKKNPITQEDRPIIYDTTPVVRFKDTDRVHREVDSIPRRCKTGDELEIKNADIPVRMQQKRTPDQNTVMGRHHMTELSQTVRRQRNDDTTITIPRTASRNAVTEMSEFLDHYRDLLTDDMVRILERSVRAPFNASEAGQARGEWLHRDGHNLHPLEIDPQRADNLGAAEKRYNTEMMIAERTIQFFALNVPQSRSKIKCDFEMLLDSDVIDVIRFVSCIQVAGFTFKITQHIDCFQKEPQCVKASDLATMVGLLFCLIHKQAPRSVQSVAAGRTDMTVARFSGNFFGVNRGDSQVSEESEEKLQQQ